ncbi:tetratricopeptide repeat protein [uncultured Microscilla sp.]|uniref:tetratricopeptide repeat protein n=1 Tax=uncultured Microscilla sp. TaxID=432653 RepID=UPI002632ED0C|nr:tetratricopeptide repeat protein [uncultured Microscilla sp.]
MKVTLLCLLALLLPIDTIQGQVPLSKAAKQEGVLQRLDAINTKLKVIKDRQKFQHLMAQQQALLHHLDSSTVKKQLRSIATTVNGLDDQWMYLKAQQYIANMYVDQRWIAQGIEMLSKARRQATEWKMKNLEARIYLQQGKIFDREHQNDEALISFLKAYEVFSALKDTSNTGDALYYVALKHYQDEDYQKATTEFRKAIKWGKDKMHERQIINSWNAIGLVFRNMKQFDSARFYYDKALAFAIEKKDSAWIGIMTGNIGTLHYEQGNYQQAEANYILDAQMSYKYKIWRSLANVMAYLGNVYTQQKKYNKALLHYDSTLAIANVHGVYQAKERAYLGLTKLMEATNQPYKANNYLWLYLEVKDSLRRRQVQNKLIKLRLAYKFREQRNKIVLLTNQNKAKEATIARQHTLNLFIGFALIMLVILATVLYRNVQIKRKANAQLQGKQDEIITKNQVLQQQSDKIANQRDAIKQKNRALEERNHQVESSIRAAFAIQNALLPHHNKLKSLMKDYFLLYRPRDVVSGDFYWVNQIQQRLYIAAIDCTGHGVPGAFMSLIANTLLDNVLRDKNKIMPADILLQLHHEVRQALRPDETGYAYGMDVGLLMINPSNATSYDLVFTGAKRPLYYINKDEQPAQILELNADRFSIGANYNNRKVCFHNHHITLPKGSVLYLSTDGIADQNNHIRRNFTSTRLKNILLKYHHQSLPQQKKALDKILDRYMADTEQRDDMLLMGIRLV